MFGANKKSIEEIIIIFNNFYDLYRKGSQHMKNMLKIACLFITLSLYNCNSVKGTDTKDISSAKTDVQQTTSKEMIEKGFSKGTIATSKSKECPYILTIEEYTDKLDPMNIEKFFKGDVPKQVWVKFASLRMPSRCNEARPVSILEIETRKE